MLSNQGGLLKGAGTGEKPLYFLLFCVSQKISVKKVFTDSQPSLCVQCALCSAVCCCSGWQSLFIILGRGQRLVSVMCEH